MFGVGADVSLVCNTENVVYGRRGEMEYEVTGSAGGRRVEQIRDRKSTRLNSSHSAKSRMPSSA